MKLEIRYKLLMLLLMVVALPHIAHAGGLKPTWIKNPPTPKNNTYYFKVVEVDNGQNLNSSRILSQKDLIGSIEREFNIKVSESLTSTSVTETKNENESFQGKEVYTLNIESGDQNVNIYYEKVDEYYEAYRMNGHKVFKLYTLYAVSRSGKNTRFDNFKLTNRYGAGAFARSIIPGWGQMYKGSTAKGVVFLSGTVVAVGGIVLCENNRASYVKKRNEQPNHASTYNSKADRWDTGRNVCIGVAAALYVYNLVDAAVAKGTPRVVVKPRRKGAGFSFAPTIIGNPNDLGYGMSLAYKF